MHNECRVKRKSELQKKPNPLLGGKNLGEGRGNAEAGKPEVKSVLL